MASTSTSSWQASTPAPASKSETNPPSWAAGQGGPPANAPASGTPAKEEGKAAAPKAEEKKASSDKIVSTKKNALLQMLSMMMEGVVFGSLYGWAVLRTEGVKLPQTKKYLGVLSVLAPLLVMDTKDVTNVRLSEYDVGLIAVHMMLSLKTWFERSLQSFGPWSLDKIASDETLSVVAFITHFRCFLHLLTKEAKGSLSKKVALAAAFALGANLTVL